MQTQKHSLLESTISTAFGFIISYLLVMLVFPLYGYHITSKENLEITAIFTIASIIRGYIIRRVFNHLSKGAKIE